MTFSFDEYFCGSGVVRLALGAGWQCLFANDNDRSKAASYAANFGSEVLKVCDVAALTTVDLPGRADLAWASFPCQDLSLAGDRAGLKGVRSGTFWSFWALIQSLRAEGRAPRMIVIENVTGLLTSHEGKDFDAICTALTEGGYHYGAVVIDASLFVPQSRERVFVVAVDKALPISADLTADKPSAPFHPSALIDAVARQPTAPIWFKLPLPPKRNSIFADIVEDKPTGVSWHDPAETGRLIGMMAPLHLAKLEAARNTDKRRVGGLYRRIRPDGAGGKVQRAEVRFDDIAGCLRMPTGGSSRQTIMIVEGPRVRSRLLSPREAARLMGVDDGYKLPNNYNEAYGLMADGVCVPAVRHLAEYVLKPLLRTAELADTGRHAAEAAP